MKSLLASFLLCLLVACERPEPTFIALDGEWEVALDSLNVGEAQGWNNKSFPTHLNLPGTTDDAGLGVADTLSLALRKPQMSHLTRRHSFIGPAWYTREVEVPASIENKQVSLFLERVLWRSDVWVDGVKVESLQCNSLTTPHLYDLTQVLKPGQKQRITIRIDNRRQYDVSVDNLAHAYTNHTQIMWNGVLGRIGLEVAPLARMGQVSVYPSVKDKKVKVKTEIISDADRTNVKLALTVREKQTGRKIDTHVRTLDLVKGSQVVECDYDMGNEVKLWDEFSPELYSLTAELETEAGTDRKMTDFGMREIMRDNKLITINGKPLFLRGTLECCIFPLTGYPPTTEEGWQKVIGTAKEWGLNHLRFHSWCPPEEAFRVADKEGFYLQVELPLWALNVGGDEATTLFLHQEAYRMMDAYGNHPSFCFWSMGNELQGDLSVASELVAELKKKDDRHLYTTTSFTFEKGYGTAPMQNDDFFITQWTNDGWVRGQGVFNTYSPSFDKDYSDATRNLSAPVITHEIGQYSVYPNMSEISKYTGTLRPLNFESIKADLESKGLYQKAADFTLSSGKLAAILYKEEIERALKTDGISGFQLLDLHDFPGQGTALVGLLDAFWDNKGAITSEEFREFCAPVVPLVRYAKATYTNQEKLEAEVDVTNYSSESLQGRTLEWSLTGNAGEVVAKGAMEGDLKLGYNRSVGKISADLSKVAAACKLTLNVSIKDSHYKNHWNMWVYPANINEANAGDVFITKSPREAMAKLNAGATVLLNPDWKQIKGVEGKFVPVFWSPVHFPKQAGTMGVLCDPKHPALTHFPNDGHGDWQWWDLCINSTTMMTDSIQGGTAIVEIIDNFVNNRRLAMIYEGKVGRGKIIIASCDLGADLEKRPVARQMLYSLLDYMKSAKFNPSEIKNPEILLKLSGQNTEAQKKTADSIY